MICLGVLGFRALGFRDFGFRGLRVEGFTRGKGGELQGKPEPQETFLAQISMAGEF